MISRCHFRDPSQASPGAFSCSAGLRGDSRPAVWKIVQGVPEPYRGSAFSYFPDLVRAVGAEIKTYRGFFRRDVTVRAHRPAADVTRVLDIPQNFTESRKFSQTAQNFTKFHKTTSISQNFTNFTKLHRISQNITNSHAFSQNSTTDTSQNFTKFREFHKSAPY